MRYFVPFTNSFRDAPYSPLELYLMGLAPASEVPTSFMLLEDARFDADSVAAGGEDVVVEASGIGSIAFADIVALHGERQPATEDERHFTAAVVVVSAQPATDASLELVSQWAESLGGDEVITGWASFETIASGRATLETRLATRRRIDQPPYIPPGEPGAAEVACDLFAQQCPLGLGCYGAVHPVCMQPGTGIEGATCTTDTDCEPGSGCTALGECAEYCDVIGPLSPDSCSQRCGGAFTEITDPATSMVVSAICEPGAGRWCDATAPDCEPDQGCYGIQETYCRRAGTTPQGQPCTEGSAECIPTTTCVAPEGSTNWTCQPYCSSHPDATGDIDCDVKCPGNFLFVATWSICLP
jgi:hypothetical protein